MDETIWTLYLGLLGFNCHLYALNSFDLGSFKLIVWIVLEQSVVDMDNIAYVNEFVSRLLPYWCVLDVPCLCNALLLRNILSACYETN